MDTYVQEAQQVPAIWKGRGPALLQYVTAVQCPFLSGPINRNDNGGTSWWC